MTVPSLRLFGPLHLQRPGALPVPLPWHRPAALLALLACHDGWMSREALATRLRPDADAATARAYLRRLLHRLRELHPEAADGLVVEPARLCWDGGSDVRDFRASLTAQRWAEALALQAQPLLAGVPPLGEAALDDWLDDERLALRRRWRAALGAALDERRAAGDAVAVLALMQRLVDDDPFDEEGVQWLLARSDDEAQRRLALQAYEQLARHLALDMALKPLPETEMLAHALRARRVQALGAPPPAVSEAAPSSVPRPPDPAGPMGRTRELDALASLWSTGDARWVTLHGPGGVGKTTLARAFVQRATPHWRDGAAWVPMAGVEGEAALHGALLAALAPQLGPAVADAPAAARLRHGLAERQLLVVLDNVEPSRPQAVALQSLVEAAPGVRWLATSRETLGVAGEHVLTLRGLAHDGDDPVSLALLARHAARHGAALALDDPAVRGVALRVVRALQGLPLAIELAAAWLPVMSPAALADQLDADLAWLASDAAAHAGAHHSLRAVFQASWARLDDRQRRVLGALALMRGPFDAVAAHEVARCEARMLLQLAGRSLLQRDDGGLFSLHPLVRQCAGEAAEAADPTAQSAARRRHAAHHLAVVAAPPVLVPGDGDPAVVAARLRQLPDIVAAWRHAVGQRDWAAVAAAQPGLEGLLALSGRLAEADALAAEAAAAMPAEDPRRALLDAWRVASLVSMDRHAEGRALADALLARGDAVPPAARCTAAAARTRQAHDRGEAEEALHWATQALAAAEAAALPVARMRCLQNLGAVRWVRGDAEGSLQAWTQMLALAEDHDATLQRARARRGLAVLAQQQGRLDEALALLQRAAVDFQARGDPVEQSQVHRSASFVLRDLGRHDEQHAQAEAALALARRVGTPHLVVPATVALALACADLGDAPGAESLWRDALARARREGMAPLQLRGLWGLAVLRATTVAGDDNHRAARVEALATLHFAAGHPALRHADRAEIALQRRHLVPRPDEEADATVLAASMDLDTATLRWLA